MKLVLLYGGRSGEHEVSLVSAAFVLEHLGEHHEVIPVWIDHSGSWFYLPEKDARAAARSGRLIPGTEGCRLESASSPSGQVRLVTETGLGFEVDFAFPVLHGTYGEDGRLQGFLETMGLPYAGAGVSGSSLAMDKILARRVLSQAGIPGVNFRELSLYEYRERGDACLGEIESELPYPIFVKPANLGSSVGVAKALNREELQAGIEDALRYDDRLILEEGKNVRELETGILGNRDGARGSDVGEIIVRADYYSYDAKYIDAGASEPRIPADLPEKTRDRARQIALAAYRVLNCEGYARADLFLDRESGEIYFNELNTIPGFTPSSMFPLLWENSGTEPEALLEEIIELGIKRSERDSRLIRKYEDSI